MLGSEDSEHEFPPESSPDPGDDSDDEVYADANDVTEELVSVPPQDSLPNDDPWATSESFSQRLDSETHVITARLNQRKSLNPARKFWTPVTPGSE